MPVTLHDFIRTAGQGDDSVAGYLEPPAPSSTDPHRFLYWRSSNPMLPAFVNCLEGGGDMRRIYTDREQAPWVRPRGPGVKRLGILRASDGDGSLTIEPVAMTSRPWPARVTAPAGPAPLPGGLHAAALSSTTSTDTTEVVDGHDTSGLALALRYYALATRTLIASSATCGFAGVHDHVGAILVSDTGAILAAGINTGSYRHAEVSLLLSWFRDNPEARTLPAKSIVFTTLTPCRQCTRYLSLAKTPDTLIRFDEADAGRSGRVGERIAEQVDVGIGAGVGAGIGAGVGAGVDQGLGRASASASPGTNATREAERRAIRNDGKRGVSRMTRSREARRVILDAADAIGRTPSRAANDAAGRNREADAGEHQTEAAVLAYLARWVLGATRVT